MLDWVGSDAGSLYGETRPAVDTASLKAEPPPWEVKYNKKEQEL